MDDTEGLLMADKTIVEENDVVLVYTVIDQDNAAVNLTGSTIKWAIRETVDATVALTKTTASGISITNAAGGEFQVTITDADTADLAINNKPTKYFMEAVIMDSSGNIYTITNDDIEPDRLIIRPIYTEA